MENTKIQLQNPDVEYPLRLVERKMLTHDTMLIKLALDSPEHIFGAYVGSHVFFCAEINGEKKVTPFTPISLKNQKGYVEFAIKVYQNQGAMARHMMNLPLSDQIKVKGPAGRLRYEGQGNFEIKPDNRSPPNKLKAKYVSMICGGTGITPMIQLIRAVLSEQDDKTCLALLYANKTEGDIILREEIEKLQSEHPEQFRVWYTVSTPPASWKYSTGYVDEKMIAEHCYPPGEDSLMLLCGPPEMLEGVCYPNLKKLNYPQERIFTYEPTAGR